MEKRLSIHWLDTVDTRGLYQKFCLIECAARGEITFQVWPRSAFFEFGLEAADIPLLKEGYSFFRPVDLHWWRIKKKNQQIFDRFLTSDAVFLYVLSVITTHFAEQKHAL
jgi:hypothetical protein